MELEIIKETTKVRDEQREKEALQFTIERRVGMHSNTAARFVIPVDGNDPEWLQDVYISVATLNLFTSDLKSRSGFNWFRRDYEKELIDLLWTISNAISYGLRGPEDGYEFVSDSKASTKKPEPSLTPTEKEVLRRKAVALLQVRNTDNLRFQIGQLRENLFKQKADWTVIS